MILFPSLMVPWKALFTLKRENQARKGVEDPAKSIWCSAVDLPLSCRYPKKYQNPVDNLRGLARTLEVFEPCGQDSSQTERYFYFWEPKKLHILGTRSANLLGL